MAALLTTTQNDRLAGRRRRSTKGKLTPHTTVKIRATPLQGCSYFLRKDHYRCPHYAGMLRVHSAVIKEQSPLPAFSFFRSPPLITFSSITSTTPDRMEGILVQQRRYLRASRPLKIRPIVGFAQNLPLSLQASVFGAKILLGLSPALHSS